MWVAEREQVQTSVNANAGNFGWPSSPQTTVGENNAVNIDYWQGCRELFLAHQRGKRVFYLKHNLPLGRGRSIAEFIEKIEKKLGIKSIRRTKVQATSKKKIVKLHVAPFWDQSDMRRSLFSALLRASLNYRMSANDKTGNLDEALYSVVYLSETKRAVDRFLNKKAVHYWGTDDHGVGWWTVFHSASNTEIGRLLKKKRKLKHPKPRIVTITVPATTDTNPAAAA